MKLRVTKIKKREPTVTPATTNNDTIQLETLSYEVTRSCWDRRRAVDMAQLFENGIRANGKIPFLPALNGFIALLLREVIWRATAIEASANESQLITRLEDDPM